MAETYAIAPALGMDISSVASLQSGSSTVYTPDWAVGAKAITSDGGEHIYIKCGATITAGDVVFITPSTGSAVGVTTTLANQTGSGGARYIAVADASLATGQYGWACLRGIPYAGINIASSCTALEQLYTTSTAGQLSTTSTSSCLISGIEATATTTSAAVVAGICTNPLLVTGVVNNQ